ncbi:hypothetical protein [Chondromyces apiculatus]|uniref:hypothetical protein n=1 Tax=Chondromyces apiculatus TaxID=51 RepID=UPI001E634352|nr:hypothetical protein [Chondromyces apiculatus]
MPGASPVQGPDGGTEFVLYRKDRARCTKGSQLLKRHKLREKSATNRVVATCCNAAMVLDFDDSKHWVSMYRARFQGDAPPLEVRVCTKFKPESSVLPDDVPSHSMYPFKFVTKLIAARIAMLFQR